MATKSAKSVVKATKVSGQAAPPADQGKQKPVNRILYESVGSEQAVPTQSSGTSAAAVDEPARTDVLNRGGYELVIADGKKQAISVEEKAPKPAEPASGKEPEESPTTRSYKMRREQRRRRKEQQMMMARRTQMLVIACSMLIFGILIAAALGLGIFLLSGESAESAEAPLVIVGARQHATYGVDQCGNDSACWAVAPAKMCNLQCSRYTVLLQVGPRTRATNTPPFDPVHSTVEHAQPSRTLPLLCAVPIPGKIGVCVDGKCNHIYNGSVTPYHENRMKGEWMDNCDEKNPCWSRTSAHLDNVFSKLVFYRNHCQNAECPKKGSPEYGIVQAIVWMSHQFCRINGDRVGTYCQGLPLRLRICRTCNSTNDPKKTEAYRTTQICGNATPSDTKSCSAMCTNGNKDTWYGFMPDGSRCAEDGINEKYCVQGGCFPLVKDPSFESKSVEECRHDRKKIRQQSKRFVLPRTASP